MFGKHMMRRMGRDDRGHGHRGGHGCGRGDDGCRETFGDHERHGGGRHRHRHGGHGRRLGPDGLRSLLLGLLAEEPRNGAALIEALAARIGPSRAASPAAVYPTLTWLAETGLVAAADDTGRLAITEAGRARLAEEAATDRATGANGTRDPRLVRAVENLRLALRLKLGDGTLSAEATEALVALLDETAGRVERS